MSHSDLNLLVPREPTEYLAICGLSPSGNALVNEVIANVLPVGRPETDLRVWPVAALVLVADPARRTRIDPAVAAEALGLTGMESRVAVLLAERHDRPRRRRGDGPRRKHDPLACEAHVRQAWPVASGGPGAACACGGRRSGIPALKAEAAADRR